MASVGAMLKQAGLFFEDKELHGMTDKITTAVRCRFCMAAWFCLGGSSAPPGTFGQGFAEPITAGAAR